MSPRTQWKAAILHYFHLMCWAMTDCRINWISRKNCVTVPECPASCKSINSETFQTPQGLEMTFGRTRNKKEREENRFFFRLVNLGRVKLSYKFYEYFLPSSAGSEMLGQDWRVTRTVHCICRVITG